MIELIVNEILKDINDIENKDVLLLSIQDKLNKSFMLYDIDTNIDLDTEEYSVALKLLTDKVGK